MRQLLALLGGLCLGIMLSQFPEYAQQYTQRLGGAVDELARITAEFDRAAGEGGITRQQALARYGASDDVFLSGRGQSMENTFDRFAELSGILARIRGASATERATLLPEFLDSEIGRRTLDDFKPAVPVTMEGFAYAGVGLLAGYGIVSALVRFVSLPFRRRKLVRR